ncbi:MAG: HAD family hydrolase [bacterium]|nr:HAD family hydrolase [bacterium]
MGKEDLPERKKIPNPTHIVFFDMDDTLWEILGEEGADEWLSKGARTGKDRLTFTLDESTGLVRRGNDGTPIRLKNRVVEVLSRLYEMDIPMGVVSDNRPQDVATVAKMFDIWRFFDQSLSHIKLYNDVVDGPCNKGFVIQDLMADFTSKGVTPHVLFIDDKAKYHERPEFSVPLARQNIQFVQSPKSTFPAEEVMRFAARK